MLIYIQSVSDKRKIAKGCYASRKEDMDSGKNHIIVRFQSVSPPEPRKTYSVIPELAFVEDDNGDVVLSHGTIDDNVGAIDLS